MGTEVEEFKLRIADKKPNTRNQYLGILKRMQRKLGCDVNTATSDQINNLYNTTDSLYHRTHYTIIINTICPGRHALPKVRRIRIPQDPEKKRVHWLMYRYGLAESQFDDIWRAQGGACNVCRRVFVTKSRAHVDHIHHTQPIEVRGLLCVSCNTKVVGMADEVGPDFLFNLHSHLATAFIPSTCTTVGTDEWSSIKILK